MDLELGGLELTHVCNDRLLWPLVNSRWPNVVIFDDLLSWSSTIDWPLWLLTTDLSSWPSTIDRLDLYFFSIDWHWSIFWTITNIIIVETYEFKRNFWSLGFAYAQMHMNLNKISWKCVKICYLEGCEVVYVMKVGWFVAQQLLLFNSSTLPYPPT